jgi:hypothetical protein
MALIRRCAVAREGTIIALRPATYPMRQSQSVKCRKCGKAVPIGKIVSQLSSVAVPAQNVNGVIRRLRAVCPDCGPFLHDRVGHHDSITEKEMRRIFPPHLWKRLRFALRDDERKLFNKTLCGKREPNEGDIERWLEFQRRLGAE